MDSQVNMKDIRGFIRRRYKGFLLVFSIIFILAVLIAVFLPPIFRSTAMILIEAQQIPQDYVQSTFTTYAEAKLHLINQQVMRPSRLKEIVMQFNLYPELVQRGEMGRAIAKLKDNLTMETSNINEGAKWTTLSFTLSYEGKDPRTVHQVAAAIADLFVQEEYITREKAISITTEFLTKELENLKEQIDRHEQRISEFKMAHSGELPDNLAFNHQNIARLELDLERLNTRIQTLEENRIYLKGQLANIDPLTPIQTVDGKLAANPKQRLKGLRIELIRMQSALSERHPDVRKLKSEIAKLEEQVGRTDDAVEKVRSLNQKNADLSELQSRLGSKHPDVIRLSKEVAALSKTIDPSQRKNSAMAIAEEKPDNPFYIDIVTRIVATDTEIENLRLQVQRIEANLDGYRDVVARTPSIEKQYNELTMDYDSARLKYDEILNKLMSAQVAQQMETQQKGEKFSILEPASMPSSPAKPNRAAIALLGFILGCAAAAGLAAFQEALDHSLKSEDDIIRLTGLPVLSSLSLVQTREERRVRRIKKVAWGLCIAGVIAAIFVLFNRFPLQVDEVVAGIRERIF